MLMVIGSVERPENPKVSLATWRGVIGSFERCPIES